MIDLPMLLAAMREKLASLLPRNDGKNTIFTTPLPPTISNLVLAPPCRIQGDSQAACLATYGTAMERGPAAGVAITILWSRLMPLAAEAAVAKAQA